MLTTFTTSQDKSQCYTNCKKYIQRGEIFAELLHNSTKFTTFYQRHKTNHSIMQTKLKVKQIEKNALGRKEREILKFQMERSKGNPRRLGPYLKKNRSKRLII